MKININSLVEKFKDSPLDRTLLKDLIIEAKIIKVPERSLLSGYIILGDETGTLEAVAPDSNIHDYLKSFAGKKQILKLKGLLGKTEYGNVAFEIEEILNWNGFWEKGIQP